MKLFMTPGACSLADHIALTEAGIDIDTVKVDLATRRTEHGDDLTAVNPKGYVPALVLDDGEVLTENVAIMAWIAEQAAHLVPPGPLGRYRNIETLAFLATEVHRPFMRSMFSPAEAEKQAAREAIAQRLDMLAGELGGDYLFGTVSARPTRCSTSWCAGRATQTSLFPKACSPTPAGSKRGRPSSPPFARRNWPPDGKPQD